MPAVSWPDDRVGSRSSVVPVPVRVLAFETFNEIRELRCNRAGLAAIQAGLRRQPAAFR
jgi:hypothetical protein